MKQTKRERPRLSYQFDLICFKWFPSDASREQTEEAKFYSCFRFFFLLAGAEKSVHLKSWREEKAYGDNYTGGVAPQRNRDW
jgi:hypothetical protein